MKTTTGMIGMFTNNSAIATRGSVREEYRRMFSVKGKVAFEYGEYCPPGGGFAIGGNMIDNPYYTQQQLDSMEEYDRTVVDSYGKGHYDYRKRVALKDRWSHESNREGNFIFDIRGDDSQVLESYLFFEKRIEMVGEGEYLHVYRISRGFFQLIKGMESFDEAVETIKASERAKAVKGLCKWSEGAPFMVGVKNSPLTVEPTVVGKGWDQIFWVRVSKGVNGMLTMTLSGQELVLELNQGSEPRFYTKAKISSFDLKPEQVFIDEIDAYQEASEIIGKRVAEEKAARQARFQESKEAAIKSGASAGLIKKALKASRLGAIKTLKLLPELLAVSKDEGLVIEALKVSDTFEVAKNFLWLSSQESQRTLNRFSVKTISDNADYRDCCEWIENLMPEYPAFGGSDAALTAIRLFQER